MVLGVQVRLNDRKETDLDRKVCVYLIKMVKS